MRTRVQVSGKTGEAYTASYAYDSAGNRTRHETTADTDSTVTLTSNNKLNQALGVETTHNGGTPSTSALSYDAAGNLARVSSSGGRSDYVFDDSNRLVQIVSRNEQGQATSKSEFVYDGMSRLRISSDYGYENGAWVARGEKRRLYDGMNAVQERDGTGALLATYTRGLSMGGGIGGLLARTFQGGTSFYHYDGHGNVTGLSDTAGAVSGKYSYDAFGNTLSASGGAAGLNPYRFSTKEQIGGLVYYGFRFYSPGLGKWINRDPIAENGGINLYRFVQNSPLNAADPDGRLPAAIAGALAGGLTELAGQMLANYLAGRDLLHCIDWWDVGIAAAGGALGTFLPPGMNQALAGGITNMGEQVASNYTSGDPLGNNLISAGIFGAAGGAVGGNVRGIGDDMANQGPAPFVRDGNGMWNNPVRDPNTINTINNAGNGVRGSAPYFDGALSNGGQNVWNGPPEGTGPFGGS